MGLFKNLKNVFKKDKHSNRYLIGMEKTRGNLLSKLKMVFSSYSTINDDLFEELEEIFIMSDIGVNTVVEFIDKIREDIRIKEITDPNLLQEIIVDKLFEIYVKGEIVSANLKLNKEGISVLLFVGVNGVGKTTSIAKIAHQLKEKGKTVMMVAGDTFRAGAINQLKIWGERVGCEVYAKEEGSDPSSVIYDAIKKAQDDNIDVLLVDTAGRLQNKVNLMKELEKVNRVISREIEGAPHEVLLTVDATTGQNGMNQAKAFMEATTVSGIILTKLDGTAKGGIVLAIRDELGIPIKYVGLGEKIEDLEYFDIEKYIYGLFADLFEDGE